MKAFASTPAYRSAAVEELVLPGDSHRRPLRPEDLDHLDFTEPLQPETVTSLSALFGHRLLMCVAEAALVTLPANGRGWVDFNDVHATRNRLLGEAMRPFLERYLFGFLDQSIEADPDVARICATLDEISTQRAAVADGIGRSDQAAAVARFALVQWMAGSQAVALASDRVRAAFGTRLPGGLARMLLALEDFGQSVAQQAASHGLAAAGHAHWQFYLPTSLAVANHLHALSHQPRSLFRTLGALAATALDAAFLENNDVLLPGVRAKGPSPFLDTADLAEVLDDLAASHGDFVIAEFSIGLKRHARLKALADDDFADQTAWFTSMAEHDAIARALMTRIEREGASIPRDTFVEPREMCSTTHVHDDERLVVVESGEMVFWNQPGMCLHVRPGEMLLVPRQRLHGSSVTSSECTYHQPIVPPEWVTLARARVHALPGV
jgi:hypothetical protein